MLNDEFLEYASVYREVEELNDARQAAVQSHNKAEQEIEGLSFLNEPDDEDDDDDMSTEERIEYCREKMSEALDEIAEIDQQYAELKERIEAAFKE